MLSAARHARPATSERRIMSGGYGRSRLRTSVRIRHPPFDTEQCLSKSPPGTSTASASGRPRSQQWIEREQPDVALPPGDQGAARRRSRPRSARSKATGATGTAKGATPGSACTCGRESFPAASRVLASALRPRNADRRGARRRADRGVDLRPERRQGLPGEDEVPRGARRVRARASARPARRSWFCAAI